MLPERVCVCLSFGDAVDLSLALDAKGLRSTILETKPMTQPLPRYARMIVASWFEDQREESRCRRGYG